MGESAAGGRAGGMPAALREARWIAGPRLRAYAAGAVLAYIAWGVLAILGGTWLFGADGLPLQTDFIAFWSAARMAIEGQVAAAYDWDLHKAVQVAAIGRDFEGFYGWHSPPHLLFVLLPF
ncbi:MAG TPA: hypothetical protein VD970_09595, partial [Acetobacteraceae bacterium]|nr:hypothetical protein [Acetobacteraceae bacterium]